MVQSNGSSQALSGPRARGTGPGIPATAIGVRATFADIGETLAAHLGLAPGRHGQGFL